MATTINHAPVRADKSNYKRGFWALMATQVQGAFSDNLFRWVIVFFLLRHAAELSGEAPTLSDTNLVTGLATVLFSVPFILFPGIFGAISDRFSKQRVAAFTKALEVGIMTLGLLALITGEAWFLWVILFLMTTQSALFSPAKYGILPEILPESRLPWGNGYLQMGTTIAIIAGTLTAGALFEALYPNNAIHWVSVILIALAVTGFLASTMITRPAPANPSRRIPFWPYGGIGPNLYIIWKDRWLMLTVLGWTYFWLAGALMQNNIISLGTVALALSEAQMSYLQGALALGIAVGAVAAGYMSRGKIEVGLIPLGALGLALFTGLLSIEALGFTMVLPLFFGAGFFGAIFLVPVAATLQQRAPDHAKGGIIATSNIFSSAGICLAGVIFLAMSRIEIGGYVIHLDIDPYLVFGIISALTVAVGIYVCILLPVFLLRFLLWILANTIYRVRVLGRDNIPEKGGALLVANHTSFLDALVILASMDRPVRFVMYQGIYEVPWVKPLAKMMNAIPITPGGGPREVVQSLRSATEAIKQGDLVCIFAEGQITRTGQMLPFRKGFERIMQGVEAPIVPVHIDQIWGSIFSFADGRFFWKLPARVPFPITVNYGKPMPSDTNAYELRAAIQVLGTEAQATRKGEAELLHRKFVHVARRHPRRLCIADNRSGALSFFKTLVGSVVLARKLKALLGQEEMVGVLLPQGVGSTLTNIALTMMGKVVVNLNYTASAESIASSARQCGMKQVVTAKAFLEQFPVKVPGDAIFLEDVMKSVEKKDRLKAILPALFMPIRRLERSLGAPRDRSSDDLATIIFSSGSEGEPKGIMLTHYNVMSNIEASIQVFPHEKWDVLVGILPFFHSFGYTGTLWVPLTQKLSAIYHPNPLEAKAIGELIHKYRGKILFSTSTFLQGLIRRCSPRQLSSLQFVVTGAEKLAPRVRDAFKEKFGVEPLEGYGTTECAPIVSVNIPDFRAPGFYQKGTKRGSIGHPLPGISVRIVDPDSRQVLQNGLAGVLQVKGPNVMKGYLNLPEKTDQVLQDGWYETGDIATIDEDGFITITDRLARFSKIGGEMVSHTKVEEELQKVLGETDRVLAVAGVPDENKGERLVVLHTLDDDRYEELMSKLDEVNLPNLWIPKQKAFYKVDEIPVLGTGKMDLKSVKVLARQLDIGD